MNNVVLVHGGFVDGSGWAPVYKILTRNGYRVTVVQNPTISLDDDVAYTKRALAAQDGPAIFVGHSYGGAVITGAEGGRSRIPHGVRSAFMKIVSESYSGQNHPQQAWAMTGGCSGQLCRRNRLRAK